MNFTKEPSFKPVPDDGVITETTQIQEHVEGLISELFETLEKQGNAMTLLKNNHLNWAVKLLFQGFPSRYVSQDASQPWLLFWLLQTFQVLGTALDPTTKQRCIDTIMANQHPDGGFSGGPYQFAHLLPTYASVCSLAIVGRKGEGGGWDQIDREKMYQWFMSLKQPDGSFIVCENAEVDMRGCYCLLSVATLLDMMTPELNRGLEAFIAGCQTYEGGFSASSQPYFSAEPPTLSTLLQSPRPALGEAHGGYTSCALASLLLLRPLSGTNPKSGTYLGGINVKRLLRWSVQMQGSAMEGGGFRGRTNKLVDGCYSWWVGGSFALIEEALGFSKTSGAHEATPESEKGGGEESEWADTELSLFNRKALQQFVLVSSQTSAGGLRDKPGKPADAYHTLYNLSGLSAAQHRVYFNSARSEVLRQKWKPHVGSAPVAAIGLAGAETAEEREARRRETYIAAYVWEEDETSSHIVGGAGNRVNATHPIFNLTMTASRAMLAHFYGQEDS